MGEGLLVYLACKKRDEGMDIDELADWVERERLHLSHWFTVDDLNHLKRGGRVSGAAAFFGTMLNIKPVLHVDDEGHLIPMEKVRGRRASLDALVAHMKKTAIDPENQVIFISHSDLPGRRAVRGRPDQGAAGRERGAHWLHRAGDRQPHGRGHRGAVLRREEPRLTAPVPKRRRQSGGRARRPPAFWY